MKLTSLFNILVSPVLALSLGACSYLSPSDPNVSGGFTVSNDKLQSLPLDFKTVSDLVIKPKCLTCHGVSGDAKPKEWLQSAGGLRAHTKTLETIVIKDKTMPPKRLPKERQLTDCQLAILEAFLAEGALEENKSTVADLPACKHTPEPIATPEPKPNPAPSPSPGPSATPIEEPQPIEVLDFKTVTARVLQPKCLRCHSDEKLLMSAQDILDNRQDIEFEVFTSGSMPPKKLPPEKRLTDCELAILKAFIDDGAPEQSSHAIDQLPACKAP